MVNQPEFDVFLAHNSQNKPQVRVIARELKQRGLKYWIDEEQIPPGRLFQDVIQLAIPNVKSAAIFIGLGGLGRWQAMELRTLISRCVDADIPVIPVLLPGVEKIPEHLLFLKELNWVRFDNRIDDVEALSNLEWGITGRKPEPKSSIHELSSEHGVTTVLHSISSIPNPPEAYIAHNYELLETETLIGRQEELNLLTDWVTNPSSRFFKARILNIVAIGGMGKSALTWKWFKDVAPHKMNSLVGQIWWSFYENDAYFENFVTCSLAYVSGVPKEDVRKLSLPERQERLLFILNRQPYLVVLDGFERLLNAYARMGASRSLDDDFGEPTANFVADAYGQPKIKADTFTEHFSRKIPDDSRHIVKFLEKLRCDSQSRILISTRLYPADLETKTGDPKPGCDALYLEGLNDSSAFDLWCASNVSGSRETMLPFFHTFDKHPLMIKLLAGAVAHSPRSRRDFDRWRRANPEFNPFIQLNIKNVRSHILEFALKELSESVREVMHTVAAFRMPASFEDLAGLLVGSDKTFLSEDELTLALIELEDRGLLGWNKLTARCDMHPVVRGATWHQLNFDTRRNIYGTLENYYESLLAIIENDGINSLEELEPIIQQYENLIGQEKYDKACELFRQKLAYLLRERFVACRQRIEFLEALFIDKQSWSSYLSYPKNQAYAMTELADALHFVGQYESTESLLWQATHKYLRLLDFEGVCKALNTLSFCFLVLGKFRKADVRLRHALLVSREKLVLSQEGSSLYFMAQLLLMQRLWDKARVASRRLFIINQSLLNADTVAIWLALEKKNYYSAMLLANRAFKTAENERSDLGLIMAAKAQGEAALHLNNFSMASERLHFALTKVQEQQFLHEEVKILILLAKLHFQKKEFDVARDLLNRVWEPLKHSSMFTENVDALNVLTQIERSAGNLLDAVNAATEAYRLARCDGSSYAYEIGLKEAQKHLAEIGISEPNNLLSFNEKKDEYLEKIEIDPPQITNITNTKNWTNEAISNLLEETKKVIGWDNTTGSARKWWEAFENENTHRWALVLRLAEELKNRKATITEFFHAYVYSNTDNIQANLYYLDYVRLQKEERNSGSSAVEALEAWAKLQEVPNASLKLINFLEFSNEEFESLFQDVKKVIGWDDTIGPARKWWENFEVQNAYRKKIIFRLIEEIAQRKSTINGFYLAYLGSNTDNIQAILTYLDYKILKEEEETKNKIIAELQQEEEERRKQVVDEVVNIRLEIEEERKTGLQVERHQVENINAAQSTPKLAFIRCVSCQSFISETATQCQRCSPKLSIKDKYDELFMLEVEKWCDGIANYPGEVFPELVYRVIEDKLSESIKTAIQHFFIFDIADVSLKLSKAAKYLVEEKEITFKILEQLPNPQCLHEDEQFVFAQILEQVSKLYDLSAASPNWEFLLEWKWNITLAAFSAPQH